ncbi:beta strand repeat-containing protein [Geomonas anaerohicana]|uniref:DUF11 domain-containing protein n=1 Tax=Geomonas anaerohicana TaxID=2798583 RepID=A0ABS0YHR3_9BACT|nr:right-handed parallel beta-helix repeat-containing protein [Geomonas anaerohicana]MBJ6751872.1 DUF11 domain-containing protein [Geomonas anaerohicana]
MTGNIFEFQSCRGAIRLTTLLLFFLIQVGVFVTGDSVALAAYYVDFSLGNDANPGTEGAPWKTLAKVNGSAVGAGDTVLLKRGQSWSEYIYPKSGTSGNSTVYSAYGTGDKPVIRGVIANNKSFVAISNMYLSNSSYYQPLSISNNSSHITIENCDVIGGATNNSGSAVFISESAYITIRKSTISHNNLNSYADALQIRGRTNGCLIEENTIGTATHYAVSMSASTDINRDWVGQNNIIRNNFVNNTEGAQVEVMSDSKHNLFDGNVISGGKSTARCSYLPRSFKLVTEGNIVRRNIIKDNLETTGSGISSEVYTYQTYPPNIAFNNRVYNNVITNITHFPLVLATNGNTGTSVYGNYYKNNVIYGNHDAYDVLVQNHTWIHDNYFQNNSIYHDGATNVIFNGSQGETSVEKVQGADPGHWFGNIDKDPLLDENLYPQILSPVIDSAAPLTHITSEEGSGISFTVADAGYFCDGWGATSGDTIQVGEAITTITAIDYAANTITVSAPIAWIQGMGVSLPYSGAALDIGAKEKQQNYTIISTAGAGGSISPAGTSTLNYGASLTYTISADTGYLIADVVVDGTSAGRVSSYTFSNITASHSISASFAATTRTIIATSGAGGSITPSGTSTLDYGASLTYTISPDSGYQIADVTADGTSVGAVSSYTFDNVTASHTISATFVADTHTITATTGTGGSIAPAGTSRVDYGASLTYTITPDSGYQISDVTVDGTPVGAVSSYTFSNVTGNHTISASFATDIRTITATAGTGGSIAPPGISTVSYGDSLTYTITPNSGYQITDVKVNDTSVGAVSSYTFSNVTANHTISATFTVTTCTISASAGTGGSIAPAGTSTVDYGGSLTYTITANSGYLVADVTVDGASVGAVSRYIFSNVTTNHTISATFTVTTHTITATAGAGGSIAPAGTSTVDYGENLTYTITANSGYQVADVTVDGTSVGTVPSYTFNNVTAGHTISATFAAVTHAITATAGAGGSIAPSGTSTVSDGGSLSYTITANSGYQISDVTVDGTPVGAVSSYTFNNVTANHTISATFAITTCSITATAGAGGSIAPAGTSTVNYGEGLTYTITANTGYVIAGVTVDGTSVGAVSSYTFGNVTVNHTISATFTMTTRTITATAGAGGSIAPAGTSTVSYGESLTCTISANTGYVIADVTVDGASVGALSSYTFSNVTANHTISATFTVTTRTIFASAGTGGSIAPAGTSTVNYGASLTYTITANSGYVIADVTVDGASVGAVLSYTFSNVIANHTISATFAIATVADLAIVKTSDQTVYATFSIITYNVTVTNNGPAAAGSVVVTDNLPAHASYQSNTGSCMLSSKKLTCNLGTVGAGQSRTFQITESTQGWHGTITNVTTVTSSTTDNNLSNNSSTSVVTVR